MAFRFVLPVMVPTHASKPVVAGVDAFLLVVILAPVFWWMVIHPLQRGIVSEQQRAVAIMRGAFHGIITIDEAGSVESVNPEAERLFGYREEELLGTTVTLLMPERYRERHQAIPASQRPRGGGGGAGGRRELLRHGVDGANVDQVCICVRAGHEAAPRPGAPAGGVVRRSGGEGEIVSNHAGPSSTSRAGAV